MGDMDSEPAVSWGAPSAVGVAAHATAPKRSFASRLFGYDIFISFALGPPPRGTHSYASDLARRLRERDFTVFFSEDEAPPGEHLDNTLRNALHRSKTLVVIANRATLQRPGWVQKEVEEFKRRHPTRPVISISVDGALQDQEIASSTHQWLGHQDKIWLDESERALENGIATEALVDRLATAPTRAKSNVSWRWIVRGIVVALAVLVVGLGVATKKANDSADRARAELRRAVSIRLIVEAQGMFTRTRNGNDERGLLQLLAAHRIAPDNETESGLLNGLLQLQGTSKIIETYATVNDVAFSPDGSRIISGSWDKPLRMWDANTGQPIDTPQVSHTTSSSEAISPDGSRIVSAYDDHTLRIKDVNTGQSIGTPLEGHTSIVSSVAFSPDGNRIISGSWDKTLRLWDAQTGRTIGTPLQGHTDIVSSVAFNPDGSRIVSGSDDKTLRLWDAKSGSAIGTPLQGHTGKVTSVAFSPDGNRIVSGSDDTTLRLWNMNSSQTLGRTTRIVAIGRPSKENEDMRYEALWRKFQARKEFSPTDLQKNEVSELLVTCMDISRDGSRIIVGGDDDTLRLWDVNTGLPIGQPMQAHTRKITSLAFSPNGSRIVSGSRDKTLRLWDTNTGQPIGGPMQGHTDSISLVAFSSDGRRIISVSGDRTLRLWDGGTGKPIGEPMQGHTDAIALVALSSDGRRIVSVSNDNDKTLRLWDAKTGKPIGEPLQERTAPVESVAISPDGSRVVTGRGDTKMQLWDANTGKRIGEPLEGHSQTVRMIVFSPDGGRFVSISDEKTLRLWDAKTGQPIGMPLQGHSGWVTSVAFSHDGRRIVSSSDDKTLRMWDVNTGQSIGPPLYTGLITFLGFSSDDRSIVTFDRTGKTLGLWPAPKIWPDELCKKLTRNMSRREWREWVSPEIDYVEQCPGLPIPSDEKEIQFPVYKKSYSYAVEDPVVKQ